MFRAREVLEYLALGGDAAPGVAAPLARLRLFDLDFRQYRLLSLSNCLK